MFIDVRNDRGKRTAINTREIEYFEELSETLTRVFMVDGTRIIDVKLSYEDFAMLCVEGNSDA